MYSSFSASEPKYETSWDGSVFLVQLCFSSIDVISLKSWNGNQLGRCGCWDLSRASMFLWFKC